MFQKAFMALVTAVGALAFLALAHSILGELSVLRPLFACPDWTIGLARRPTERLFRFAWHLTSVAWLTLAAILLGATPGIAVGIGSILSSALVFVMLRAHLAWPIFFVGGLSALHMENALPPALRWTVVGLACCVALVAAGLHLYWAAGGRIGLKAAVPQDGDGQPLFVPGPLSCTFVALLLCALAALFVGTALRPNGVNIAASAVALAGLVLRAAGDGHRFGFTKTVRNTSFGRADDAVFTPLVALLAFGAFASLLSN